MLLRYALVLGVAGGLGEAVYLTVRHLIAQRPAAWYSPDVIWMAPLSMTVVYLAVAVMIGLVLKLISRRAPHVVMVFLFVFPAVYGITQLPGFAIHQIARLALALGVSVAVSSAVGERAVSADRLVRRATPLAAALLVLLMAWGWWGLPGSRERRALNALPDATAGATNVLLIILDTVRAANLSLYGYERLTTPNLDTWADSAVVFDHAIAPSPWTLPTHASLFTGEYNRTTRTGISRPLDRRFPTLAEMLAAQGYATAGMVANLGYTTRTSGLHRGFALYEDFPITPGMFVTSSWVARQVSRRLGRVRGYPQWEVPKTAEHITDRFESWLDARDGTRPFFVFLNYYDAHSPYRGPPEYRSRFGQPAEDEFEQGRPYARDELQPWINAYDGSIAYIDDQLKRIFTKLEASGLRDNTLVIITSDHGEMFGEHGQIEHTSGLYLPVLQVPLVMALPGSIPAGARVTEAVTLRDVAATVLDLLGVHGTPIGGESLAVHWTGPTAATSSPLLSEFDFYDWAPSWTPIARGDMKSLVQSGLHYIRNGDGVEELYDIRRDPAAARDLSLAPEAAGSLLRIRSSLDSVFR